MITKYSIFNESHNPLFFKYYKELENKYGEEIKKGEYIGNCKPHDCDKNAYKHRKIHNLYKGSILFFDTIYKSWRTTEHIFNVNDNNEVIEYTDLSPLNFNDFYYFGKPYNGKLKDIWLNESIKHLLKPKNEEEILNSIKDLEPIEQINKLLHWKVPLSNELLNVLLKKLQPTEKIFKGCRLGLLWLVEEGIKEGGNPSKSHNAAIRIASINGYNDIVNYLMKDERVNNNLSMGDLHLLNTKTNESIKHLLKPKDENYSIEKFNNLRTDKKEDILYNMCGDKFNTLSELYEFLSINLDINYDTLKNRYKKLNGFLFGKMDVADILSLLSDNELNKLFYKINYMKESIRHLLKPKSDEEILDKIKDVPPHLSIHTILKNDLYNIMNKSDIIDIINKSDEPETLELIFKYNLQNEIKDEKIKELIDNSNGEYIFRLGVEFDDIIKYIKGNTKIIDDFLLEVDMHDFLSIISLNLKLKDVFSKQQMEDIKMTFKDYVLDLSDELHTN